MPGRLRTGCDFYPRPPRGGRPPYLTAICSGIMISIHALREEGDLSSTILESPRRSFLSTPSARRATAEQLDAEYQAAKFLSTPSARRATLHPVINPQIGFYFYPRPPRGGRPMWMSQKPLTPYFYPRPPRGGRLLWMLNPLPACKRFLSTPSARRATDLYKERDLEKEFLSTPSARRATFLPDCRAKRKPRFLSTPSARRATHLGIIEVGFQRNFYPRPPRGGRPCALWRSPLFQQISIHALREEGDRRQGPL